ncbi:MAG: thioredoxin [Proteobacteria bacterium]|nr:thioredoxin [Pseudomonadota bacterium]
MTDAAFVFDATEQTFDTEVMQASLSTPVLVDFWATWCAPCKALGPILEKVVASYTGKLKLAKVDTDKEMQLAGAFGIRSLPTVVLVKDGQMVDGFMGALPEADVRAFVEKHLGKSAAADAIEAKADSATALETPQQTIARLREEIAANADKPELQLDLALALVRAGDADAAQAQLDALPPNLASDAKAKRASAQLDLSRALTGAPDPAALRARLQHDAADHTARDLLGVHLLLGDEPAQGLDEFLILLRTARDWNEGRAKKRLIAAFNLLDDDEIVGTYRRKMSSLLF